MLWNRHLLSMATWEPAAWMIVLAWGCRADPGLTLGSTFLCAGGGGDFTDFFLHLGTLCVKGSRVGHACLRMGYMERE